MGTHADSDSDTSGTDRSTTYRTLATRITLVVALFIAANLSLGAVLDRTRNRCIHRESGLINNARRMKPEVIILGSSRAKYHYDQNLLTALWGRKVYNAGFPGQALPFARVAFDLIASVHKPKAVIVDVMAFEDDMDRVHAFDPWYFESAVLRGMPAPEQSGKTARTPSDPAIRCWMSFAAYRYADQVSRNFRDLPHHGEGPDFDPLPCGYDQKNWRSYEKPQPHKDFPWYGLQLAALIEEIQATGAEIVVVFSPTFKMGNEQDFTGTAESVCRQKGVTFVDFSKVTLNRPEDKKYYYDGGHLNGDGATIYTREVAKNLRRLLPRTFQAENN